MAADDDNMILKQILIRLEVEDLIRCKGVCKSWYSLISAPCFVESYLKRIYHDDPELTKRIAGIATNSCFLSDNILFVVGSANGLVCVSPESFQLLVVNPCTRQTMKILEPPPEPLPESDERWELIWGFGYDPCNNDYKIVVGLETEELSGTRFYVYSLKTRLWKFIEEYDYVPTGDEVTGVLCDGALHWHMTDCQTKEHALFSFNLSREVFTITTQLPYTYCHDPKYCFVDYILGVVEGGLCIYITTSPPKIWVLRSSDTTTGGNRYWELLPDNYVLNYEAVYQMNDEDYSTYDAPELSNTGEFIGAPIYVRSLVSPHVNMDKSGGSNDVAEELARYNELIKGPSARL